MILRNYRITCFQKLNLFSIVKADDIVKDWCCLLQEKYGCTVVNYHLYPNKLDIQLLAQEDSPVKKIISNGKRFMAYEIVFRLHLYRRKDIIRKLEEGRSFSEVQRGQLHKVFDTHRWNQYFRR